MRNLNKVLYNFLSYKRIYLKFYSCNIKGEI